MAAIGQYITKGLEIIAEDPGDIEIQIENFIFPVKKLTVEKKIDVTAEYGSGSHQAYFLTVGKIGYSGSFTVGTWIDKNNLTRLIKLLESQQYEGVPCPFNIAVYKKAEQPIDACPKKGERKRAFVLKYCKVTGDSYEQGEPGETILRTFPFMALRRDPY